MLEDLLKNNKPEYVHIHKGTNDENIVKPMIVSSNMENLRYFYVDRGYYRAEITLDITQEYPMKLQVY